MLVFIICDNFNSLINLLNLFNFNEYFLVKFLEKGQHLE